LRIRVNRCGKGGRAHQVQNRHDPFGGEEVIGEQAGQERRDHSSQRAGAVDRANEPGGEDSAAFVARIGLDVAAEGDDPRPQRKVV
jgi:hypothetical protein